MLKLTLPIVPSVNHCYRNVTVNRRILTKDGQNWLHQAQWTAKAEAKKQGWNITDGVKLIMEIWTYWPDNRRRDTHNSHKLLCDALEGVLYVNDRFVLVRDMDFTVDKHNPRVEIVLRRGEG
jgi:crossover junction endodeoxyribonuclease RusA